MIFTGQFKSLHKDTLYTVNIDCSTGGDHTVPIRLGTEPFTTSMDGNSNTIYVPVKYQSANIQVVANNSQSSFFNLYAYTPKQNKVELKQGDKIIWTGYTSPNIYDTPYDFETETWTIEAIDRLSVLKYYDYTPLDGSLGFVSFTRIINACLLKAGFDNSSHWHFSNATHVYDNTVNSGQNKSFLTDQLYISEADFFDEDDTPMKMNEVLEEICKYCGVTCIAYGNDVYFLDYDAIKNATSTYKKYYNHTVGVDSSVTTATNDCSVCASHEILASSYTATGTNLSLDNVYSKVTVKDSLYTVDSIIPSLFEDEDLQNVMYVNDSSQYWNYDFTQMTMDQGSNVASWPFFNWEKAREDDTYVYMKSRYYTNKKYNHPVYDNSGNGPSLVNKLIDSSLMDAINRQGILMSRFSISTGKTQGEAIGNMQYDDFTDYLMLTVNHTGSLNSIGKPKLETKSEFTKPFFMSGKAKLIAKGTVILTDRYKFPAWNFTPGTYDEHPDVSVGYFPNTGPFKGDYDGWTLIWDFGNQLKVPKDKLKLRIDVGINGVDLSTNVPFYPLNTQDSYLYEDGGSNAHHEVFYTNLDIQNSINYEYCIDDKGYILNTGLAEDDVVNVKPIIKIYGVDDLIKQFGTKNPLACVFIKDFDIKALVGYQGGKNENDTDTEYSYVINDDYVQELGAIEFKICTYDNKQLTYSAPAWRDPSTVTDWNDPLNGKFKFVDVLRNRALGEIQRSEHLMCYRIVHQYSTASKKLSINLFQDEIRPWTLIHEPLLNTDFVIDTISYDFGTDTARCEIVEKK